MVSLYKVENSYEKTNNNYISAELRGLSTDEKPTEIGENKIDNGSIFIEIDTGDVYIYDLENEEWKGI